jgi:hypothetical protein
VTAIPSIYKKMHEFAVNKAETLMPTPRKVKKEIGQYSPLIIKPYIMYNMKLNQDSWHWSIMESVTITQRVL